MYKSLVIIVFLTYSSLFFAQSDTSAVLIGEVKVISRIESLSSENNLQKTDSFVLETYPVESLATLLSQTANISIKQYGVSGISTLSIRGGNSYHTAVVWNGFNLQDVLNGGFNFTLAPVDIAENISVKYGGSSAIYGSGAMGGSIILSNKARFNSGFTAQTDLLAGSFGKTGLKQSFAYGTKKMYAKLKAFYSKTDNNFPYVNYAKAGYPTETLKNAAMEQYGLLFDGSLKIRQNQFLNVHYWAQNNYTQIPPNMIASGNDYATQYDRWHRFTAEWKYKGNIWKFTARNGLFYTYLNYINNSISLNATHQSINNISEFIADWRFFKKTSLEFALNNNYASALSDNFSGKEKQNRLAVFTSLKTKYLQNFIFNLNSRFEWIDARFQPVTFGLFVEYILPKNYFINLNWSKNHRIPTFNDLFWAGAYASGNPGLKDETGYTADFSAIKKINTRKLDCSLKTSIYYHRATDMIQWVPVESIWTPQNQKNVQSYGTEFFVHAIIKLNIRSFVKINANYVYTKAQIVEKSAVESNDIIGKQLIYTPYHSAGVFISYAYKNITLSLMNQYTGKQYTRTDNSDSLDAYFLMNLSASYKLPVKFCEYQFFAKINNLLNADYMQMQWFPAPPLNFELGITLILTKNRKK